MAVEVFASVGFKPLLFVLRYDIGALPVMRLRDHGAGFLESRPAQVALFGSISQHGAAGKPFYRFGGGGFLKVVGSPGQQWPGLCFS